MKRMYSKITIFVLLLMASSGTLIITDSNVQVIPINSDQSLVITDDDIQSQSSFSSKTGSFSSFGGL
jgi:hypothetical protein